MPHLMAKSSTSMLVTNDAWWTILVSGWFAMCTCNIDVAISFLMLASVMTRAVWGDRELYRTMLSSSWAQILSFSFSFLVTKLKEKQSEKISIMWEPGTNSWLRGKKKGKILYDLLQESIRWLLVMFFWWLVKELIECGFGEIDEEGKSSMRFLKMWLVRSLKGQICNLLAIFWRWNLTGIIPAMALISSDREVLKASKIQMAALLCILFRIFIWYDDGALL